MVPVNPRGILSSSNLHLVQQHPPPASAHKGQRGKRKESLKTDLFPRHPPLVNGNFVKELFRIPPQLVIAIGGTNSNVLKEVQLLHSTPLVHRPRNPSTPLLHPSNLV